MSPGSGDLGPIESAESQFHGGSAGLEGCVRYPEPRGPFSSPDIPISASLCPSHELIDIRGPSAYEY